MTSGPDRGTVSGYRRAMGRVATITGSNRSHRSHPSHAATSRISLIYSTVLSTPRPWSVRAVALNNPAFNNPAFQDKRAVQSYPGGPQAANLGTSTQTAAAQQAGVNAATQAQLEGMYAAPAAGAIETDRMTVEDTVWKTMGLFAVLLVTAAVGWVWTMSTVTIDNPSPTLMPWIIGLIGGTVLAFVVIFTSR